MSQQKVTTSTNQYNAQSMNSFQNLNSAGSTGILGNINDPYSNSAFNTQNQMMRQNNAQMQSSAMQALMQRSQALGQGNNSPLLLSQIGQQQRQGMAQNAQGYNSLLLNAAQLRQQSLGAAMNYKPLQTGGTQTQTMGGLGTWLPQLAGAALGAAGGAMTGGLSMAGGGMARDFSGAGQMGPDNGSAGASFFPDAEAPDFGFSNPNDMMSGGMGNPFMSSGSGGGW